MRKENAKFVTKFISEPGSYLVNADYVAFVELNDYACYVIADGIDVDEKKESAKLAVTTVIANFSETPGMSAGKLKRYIKAAHDALINEASEIRLEASILVIVTDYKKVRWAHAGNCRLEWIRNGNIKASTKDTSLTQKMVDNEELPMDAISYHEERNNLYSYLGQPGRMTPVVSGKKVLEDGDILLMLSRGAWENVGNPEIIDAVDGVSNAEEVCTGLEDVILSQRLEIIENYTITTIFVDKIYKNPKAGKYKKFIKIGITISVLLLMMLLMFAFAKYKKNKSNMAKAVKSKDEGISYLEKKQYTEAKESFLEGKTTIKDMNIKESSKYYEDSCEIKNYYDMTEYLCFSFDSMKEDEFKKATSQVNSALELAYVLKDENGENMSEVIAEIKDYAAYSSDMKDGNIALDKSDYDDAIRVFDEASKLMNGKDDNKKKVADEKLNNAKFEKISDEADELFEEAKNGEGKIDDVEVKGKYSKARDKYEMVAQFDTNGINVNNNDECKTKIAELEEKIKDSGESVNRQRANKLEEEGDEAKKAGDYDKANEKYDAAKEMYSAIGDTSSQRAIEDKKNNIENLISEGSVNTKVQEKWQDAFKYLLDEKYEKAKSNLEDAIKIYSQADENKYKDNIKELNDYKDKIDDLIEKNKEDKEDEIKKEIDKITK